jgi:hypothetical protein
MPVGRNAAAFEQLEHQHDAGKPSPRKIKATLVGIFQCRASGAPPRARVQAFAPLQRPTAPQSQWPGGAEEAVEPIVVEPGAIAPCLPSSSKPDLPRYERLRSTMQAPPARRISAHRFSALSRVSVPTRIW